MRVALRVPKRRKTYSLRKQGNVRKVSRLHSIEVWCPVFLPNKVFANTNKKLLKN